MIPDVAEKKTNKHLIDEQRRERPLSPVDYQNPDSVLRCFNKANDDNKMSIKLVVLVTKEDGKFIDITFLMSINYYNYY